MSEHKQPTFSFKTTLKKQSSGQPGRGAVISTTCNAVVTLTIRSGSLVISQQYNYVAVSLKEAEQKARQQCLHWLRVLNRDPPRGTFWVKSVTIEGSSASEAKGKVSFGSEIKGAEQLVFEINDVGSLDEVEAFAWTALSEFLTAATKALSEQTATAAGGS